METIRVYEREESMNSQHNHAMTATISQHEVYAEASHWRSPLIHFLKPPYPIIMDPSKVRFMPLQAHSGERLLLLDRVNTCKLNLPQSKPFSLNIHGQKNSNIISNDPLSDIFVQNKPFSEENSCENRSLDWKDALAKLNKFVCLSVTASIAITGEETNCGELSCCQRYLDVGNMNPAPTHLENLLVHREPMVIGFVGKFHHILHCKKLKSRTQFSSAL